MRIRIFYLAIAILFVIAFAQNICALGITPGRAVFDYAPGRQEDVSFKVINNEHKDMIVLIYVEGELSQNIALYQKMVEFKADEEEKELKYTFNLPMSLERPGTYKTRIMAMEVPEKSETGTFVGATPAVTTELYIKVPYPGKYLEMDLDIKESDVNETTRFIVSTFNSGEEKIAGAYAIINILNKTNDIVATLRSDTAGIDLKQRKDFIVEWKANALPGSYVARATVIYDEKTDSIEKLFDIGTVKIELVDIIVENFKLGGIAKFTIIADNKWDTEIKDVYSKILIFNSLNETIADSKSATMDFPAFKRTTMFAFWDTGVGNIQEGDYKGRITIYYSNKTIDREINAKVRAEELKVEVVGLTAKVVGTGGVGSSTFWLIVIVIVLALMNLAWFIYFKNKRHHKKK